MNEVRPIDANALLQHSMFNGRPYAIDAVNAAPTLDVAPLAEVERLTASAAADAWEVAQLIGNDEYVYPCPVCKHRDEREDGEHCRGCNSKTNHFVWRGEKP